MVAKYQNDLSFNANIKWKIDMCFGQWTFRYCFSAILLFLGACAHLGGNYPKVLSERTYEYSAFLGNASLAVASETTKNGGASLSVTARQLKTLLYAKSQTIKYDVFSDPIEYNCPFTYVPFAESQWKQVERQATCKARGLAGEKKEISIPARNVRIVVLFPEPLGSVELKSDGSGNAHLNLSPEQVAIISAYSPSYTVVIGSHMLSCRSEGAIEGSLGVTKGTVERIITTEENTSDECFRQLPWLTSLSRAFSKIRANGEKQEIALPIDVKDEVRQFVLEQQSVAFARFEESKERTRIEAAKQLAANVAFDDRLESVAQKRAAGKSPLEAYDILWAAADIARTESAQFRLRTAAGKVRKKIRPSILTGLHRATRVLQPKNLVPSADCNLPCADAMSAYAYRLFASPSDLVGDYIWIQLDVFQNLGGGAYLTTNSKTHQYLFGTGTDRLMPGNRLFVLAEVLGTYKYQTLAHGSRSVPKLKPVWLGTWIDLDREIRQPDGWFEKMKHDYFKDVLLD